MVNVFLVLVSAVPIMTAIVSNSATMENVQTDVQRCCAQAEPFVTRDNVSAHQDSAGTVMNVHLASHAQSMADVSTNVKE